MTTPPMSLGMTHDDLSDLIDQLRGDELRSNSERCLDWLARSDTQGP